MAIQSSTFMRDVLFFIKDDLDSNVTDPISSRRITNSKFILTAYPQRQVQYPVVTLQIVNTVASRAGMQTNAMDMVFTLEVRVWARNTKERDELFTDILNRLRTIQFTATTGSIANDLHDFNVLSAVDVNEDGERGIKSKVMECVYRFFNVS